MPVLILDAIDTDQLLFVSDVEHCSLPARLSWVVAVDLFAVLVKEVESVDGVKTFLLLGDHSLDLGLLVKVDDIPVVLSVLPLVVEQG